MFKEHIGFLIKFFTILSITVGTLMTYEISTKEARLAKERKKIKENSIKRLIRLKQYEEIATKRIRY